MDKFNSTIQLMKKTSNHPTIFHILHCTLYSLKNKHNFTTTDLFSLIILHSFETKHNFNLENKILLNLKEIRIKKDISKEYLIKIRGICYYLISKSKPNTFILFELMNHHYNYNLFNDSLIDYLISKSFVNSIFNINIKTIHKEAIIIFLNKNNIFSIKKYPIYAFFDICPPLIKEGNLYFNTKLVEILSFYGKYTKNINYLKEVFPQNNCFIKLFKEFISKEIEVVEDHKDFNIGKLISSNELEYLFKQIKYYLVNNKSKEEEKEKIIKYIENITL